MSTPHRFDHPGRAGDVPRTPEGGHRRAPFRLALVSSVLVCLVAAGSLIVAAPKARAEDYNMRLLATNSIASITSNRKTYTGTLLPNMFVKPVFLLRTNVSEMILPEPLRPENVQGFTSDFEGKATLVAADNYIGEDASIGRRMYLTNEAWKAGTEIRLIHDGDQDDHWGDAGIPIHFVTGPIRARLLLGATGTTPLAGRTIIVTDTIGMGDIQTRTNTDEYGAILIPGAPVRLAGSGQIRTNRVSIDTNELNGFTLNMTRTNVRVFDEAVFRILRGGIAGRVLRAQNQGLSNQVMLLSYEGTTNILYTVTTRGDGTYAFPNTLNASSNYWVRPLGTAGGMTFEPLEFQGTHVGETKDFTLIQAPIRGRVTSGGQPVPGVTLQLCRPDNTLAAATLSNQDGRFSFAPLSANNNDAPYNLKAIKTGVVLSPAMTTVFIGETNVTIQATFSISGNVLSGLSQPVAGVTIQLQTNLAGTMVNAAPPVVTGDDGSFSFSGLRGGGSGVTYQLTATAPTMNFLGNPRSVTLTSNSTNVTIVNFTRSITGRITLDGSNGLPSVFVFGAGSFGFTDNSGRYEIRLPSALLNAQISVVPQEPAFRFSPPYQIVTLGTTNVNFTATGNIRGKVVYLNGSPVPGIQITTAVSTNTTGTNGGFIIAEVANGTYQVTPSAPGYIFNPPSLNLPTGRPEEAVFQVVQSPPFISSIPDQFTAIDTPTDELGFTVSDREQNTADLDVSFTSSDPSVATNVVIRGTRANRTVKVTPVPGRSGSSIITLTVSDRQGGVSQATFELNVGTQPAYALINLGIAGTTNSSATGINDAGQVTGFTYGNNISAADVFRVTPDSDSPDNLFERLPGSGSSYSNLTQASQLAVERSLDLAPYFGGPFISPSGSVAWFGSDLRLRLSLNGANPLVPTNGLVLSNVFPYAVNGRFPAGFDGGGTLVAFDGFLGSNGVGNFPKWLTVSPAGVPSSFLPPMGVGLAPMGVHPGGSPILARGGTNNNFQVALVNGAAISTITNFANFVLPSGSRLVPRAINADTNIAGTYIAPNEDCTAFFYDRSAGTLTLLNLPGGSHSMAYGINDRNEVVGQAIVSGKLRAFLYRGGRVTDLNDTIPGTSGWTLGQARAINENGEIAGTGRFNNRDVAFKLVPATVAGKAVPAPTNSVPRQPTITILSKPPQWTGPAETNYFHWSDFERKLYALAGDITARIDWPTNANLTEEGTISTVVRTVWPPRPQKHVVNAPVELEPSAAPAFPYRYFSLAFFDTRASTVDTATKIFNARAPGWSVIQYYATGGADLDPLRQPLFFQVVHSDAWNTTNAFPATARTADIGSEIEPETAFSSLAQANPGVGLELVAKSAGANFDGLTLQFEQRTGLGGTTNVTATLSNRTLFVGLRRTTNEIPISQVLDAINRVPNLAYQARALSTNQTVLLNTNFALSFDGVDDYVAFPHRPIPSSGAFTVECWAYGDQAGLGAHREMISQGGSYPTFYLGINADGTIRAGDDWVQTGVRYPYDAWHHFAVVKSATNALLYIDGELAASRGAPIGNPPAAGTLFIGRQYAGGEFWQGQLDEVRIWNTARSQVQIQANQHGRVAGATAGLAACYRFDNGSGAILSDLTAAGQHGTLTPANGPAWVSQLASATTSGGKLFHDDYPNRSGYVLNRLAFYDGTGPERAYDRAGRLGQIFPVNQGSIRNSFGADDMLVVWYRRNSIGVAWADNPVTYDVRWPTNAEPIIIADLAHAPEMSDDLFPVARVYSQTDTNEPGFNPNEEHASIVDGRITALRNDLNGTSPHALALSEAFVLVKYRDPFDLTRWRMKPYQVIREDATHRFRYPITAGLEVQPPFPLYLLPLCGNNQAVSGPWFKDYKGKFHAYSAGPGRSGTNGVIRYWYPLQRDFYWDLDRDYRNDVADGTCIPWLDRRADGGVPDIPIDVTYDIEWPENIPALRIGETLTTARNGLPEIYQQAATRVIFEGANPGLYNPYEPGGGAGVSPTNSGVRIYDPLSDRILPLPTGYQLPGGKPSNRDLTRFPQPFLDLPFVLRSRFFFDDAQRALIFRGFTLIKDQPPDSPLLLPNVLTRDEREEIKALSEDATWRRLIDDLYELTRNPNSIVRGDFGIGPDAVLTGLTTRTNTSTGLLYLAPEDLGSGPKALTAAFAVSASAAANLSVNRTAWALNLDGDDDYAGVAANVIPAFGDFTVECWVSRDASSVGSHREILSQGASGQGPAFYLGHNDDANATIRAGDSWVQTGVRFPTGTNHIALVKSGSNAYLYTNGVLAAMKLGGYVNPPSPGLSYIGRQWAGGEHWKGGLDELRVWRVARTAAEIQNDMRRALNSDETGLNAYFRFDEGSGASAVDSSPRRLSATHQNGAGWRTGLVPLREDNGYVTVVFNNDPSLPGLPVTVQILRVDCAQGPIQGNIRVIPSDNVFDERLTLRHNGDFGLEPERFNFEWWYHPGGQEFPILPPPFNPNGPPTNGWILYSPGTGAGRNQITLGQGGEAGVLTISDNRWIVRYSGGYSNACGTNWSLFAGDPSLLPDDRNQPAVAQLAEGWIKRVTAAINPFDARVSDFRNSTVNTFASLLISIGRRYQGDVAFNPDVDNVESIGLIETYETILRRGRSLSIDNHISHAPANDALLLATTKISDLYMLLGNEAFADAEDPTIGFTTSDGGVGSLAPSIFAFQNQVASLLEEELALLRGTDENRSLAPYNKLIWNFTSGEGQVAYKQVYNIYDTPTRNPVTRAVIPPDGFIDEYDAAFLYPQGHGDAWGHYLSALRGYYRLLREPATNFVWVPRSEFVLVAGTAVEVDYQDEQKFARAAAAKARTGAHIADLTYRQRYVGNPEGQWQGYEDTDPQRAWGVTEWNRRAGQGAYFDWVVANAILPAKDPNTNHTSIQKIDRTTVSELKEIASSYQTIQAQEDKADQGLNPIGLAQGAIAFDIDPTFLDVGSTAQVGQEAVQGLGHFEQIAQRALKALNNAVRVFNHANELTQNLRRNQDDSADFAANVAGQEGDFKNRLIELFGYPYAGVKGAGKPYASSYDGPDLLFFNYVDATDLTGGNGLNEARTEIATRFATTAAQIDSIPDGLTPAVNIMEVNFPIAASGWSFTAPSSWGQRRAPGEIQMAISDMLQAQANLEQGLREYSALLASIESQVATLKDRHNVNEDVIEIVERKREQIGLLNATIGSFKALELIMKRANVLVDDYADTSIRSLPTIAGPFAVDISAPARATISTTAQGLKTIFQIVGDSSELAQSLSAIGKEHVGLQTDLEIVREDRRYEVRQILSALESLIQQEPAKRVALHNLQEVLAQSGGRYRAKLAEAVRVLDSREAFRKRTASRVADTRYRDMTFRIFRNDAIQKYRAQFDLAARYVYLAATAYDYETTFLGTQTGAGQDFLSQIVKERALGEVVDSQPIPGRHGLADSLGRLMANFSVLKPGLGFNNPQLEAGQFSLRQELFRQRSGSALSDQQAWRNELQKHRVTDLWLVPEFRRYCRPFAPSPEQGGGAQPGLVIPFSTTVTFGLNHFGWPLAGGDGSYDASRFSTKVRSVGTSFSSYPTNAGGGLALSRTPRIYLVPVGTDILRSAAGNTLETREFKVFDQKIPVPFPIGNSDLNSATWIPQNNSLSGAFIDMRRHSSYLATSETTFDPDNTTTDSRLIGRSVWNTGWMLIIPGGTLLNDPNAGLDTFIAEVSDITLYFQTYSFSGN